MSDSDWKEDIVNEKLDGKSDWTDAERMELSRHLDKDMEDRFDQLIKGKNISDTGQPHKLKDGWTEENWKEEMGQHPMFAGLVQDGSDGKEVIAPDNELTEGLAQLKYHPDHNSPQEIAQSYKEEGVHHFQYRKYRLAVASFSAGLRVKAVDSDLLAQLLNNRAAAHYRLGNYRHAIRDCEQAVALKPTYRKAIQRGAESADRLGLWEELIKWADKGLLLDASDTLFVDLRKAAVYEKNKCERITRKKQSEENHKLVQMKQLQSQIRERGVNLEPKKVEDIVCAATDDDEDEVTAAERELAALPDLEPIHPTAVGSKVHQNKAGDLVWPVLLVYPEYQQTDFIQHFNEKHTFLDQLEVVFGDGSPPPPWDKQRQYSIGRIAIYYEDRANNALVQVQLHDTLKDTLNDTRLIVQAGTPSFIIAVSGSKFLNSFSTKYD